MNGCFWHGCKEHASWPKANADWWRNKIEANRRRDRETDLELAGEGWLSIRVWEHEDMESVAQTIAAILGDRASCDDPTLPRS